MSRRRRGRRPGAGSPGPSGNRANGPAGGRFGREPDTGPLTLHAIGAARATGRPPRRPYEGGHGRWQGDRGDDPRTRRAPENTGAGRYAQTERFASEMRSGRQGRPRPEEQAARPQAPRTATGGTIDPFELFCSYHLGIAPDGAYRIQNIHEVARRFGTNAGALRQTLGAYGMEADDIVHSGFDLASAQIDIMVAPEGVSRRELARPLYDEFKAAPRRARNWARELEEAERQIERTIGRDGRWSPGPRDPTGKQ